MKKLILILLLIGLSGNTWADDHWQAYQDGKLTPPAVVQHDIVNGQHLIWVWDGMAIQGPFSRSSYDEKEITATAAAIAAQPKQIEQVDARDTKIVTLEAQVVTLTAANAKLTADLAAAKAEAAEVTK